MGNIGNGLAFAIKPFVLAEALFKQAQLPSRLALKTTKRVGIGRIERQEMAGIPHRWTESRYLQEEPTQCASSG